MLTMTKRKTVKKSEAVEISASSKRRKKGFTLTLNPEVFDALMRFIDSDIHEYKPDRNEVVEKVLIPFLVSKGFPPVPKVNA